MWLLKSGSLTGGPWPPPPVGEKEGGKGRKQNHPKSINFLLLVKLSYWVGVSIQCDKPTQ